jgi:hypothetical protein
MLFLTPFDFKSESGKKRVKKQREVRIVLWKKSDC